MALVDYSGSQSDQTSDSESSGSPAGDVLLDGGTSREVAARDAQAGPAAKGTGQNQNDSEKRKRRFDSVTGSAVAAGPLREKASKGNDERSKPVAATVSPSGLMVPPQLRGRANVSTEDLGNMGFVRAPGHGRAKQGSGAGAGGRKPS
ncbi:unnamed protein product [Pedinophyceae sp. YPF-701]|nr:unnamed protein product [Pedinophyceae sp. YPF-701]